MVTNPLESSMFRRVGFDPQSGHLTLFWHDGTVRTYRVDVQTFAEFMCSPSKGKFWHARLKGLPALAEDPQTVTTQKEGGTALSTHADDGTPTGSKCQSHSGGGSVSPSPVLQTYEPDDCCGTPLYKAMRTGALDQANEWTCPKCGSTWRPRPLTITGTPTMRHWEPACDAAIILTRWL